MDTSETIYLMLIVCWINETQTDMEVNESVHLVSQIV